MIKSLSGGQPSPHSDNNPDGSTSRDIQDRVYGFLKNNPGKPYKASEIAKHLMNPKATKNEKRNFRAMIHATARKLVSQNKVTKTIKKLLNREEPVAFFQFNENG